MLYRKFILNCIDKMNFINNKVAIYLSNNIYSCTKKGGLIIQTALFTMQNIIIVKL